ncbi:MAG: methylated-DNA--[protein]-cysteine S-methyltransferase [Oscillospiraceae bacterium]|nr:methylated-DNA--[protein]-cysteine S-methyltransferase [Oscillospiraceae bacterium]
MDKKIWHYHFDVSKISIVDDGFGISEISFKNTKCFYDCIEEETPLILETSKQLREYFCGKRKSFDIPLSTKGTPFQTKVWNALKLIPYGKTQTYKEIATIINSPKACRAVGMANNKNPISIIIPCHRVVGSNNSLVGYASGIHIKKYLLELEKRNI